MGKIKHFYDFDVWKKGHNLVLEIYKITKNFPKEELFGITSQIRRAASSVTANLVEGFGRFYFKDKIRFYYQARGSIFEVEDFLFLALDLGFINNNIFRSLLDNAEEIIKQINLIIKTTINKNSSDS